jgi:hypothetical protein
MKNITVQIEIKTADNLDGNDNRTSGKVQILTNLNMQTIVCQTVK